MSFSQELGYVPVAFNDLMSAIRTNINTQFGTDYTEDSFVGTNWYKYFYALLQRVQENETKTAEIFLKLQEYFAVTNELIQRPSVSAPGIVDAFTANGFIASVKPPVDADAGKIFICLNLDDGALTYPTLKLQACRLIKTYVAAGVVSQGTEVETIVLSNGQGFDFKFNLPNFTPIKLELTITESENNLLSVDEDTVSRQLLFNHINARYGLGKDFEPNRYFNQTDAPWSSTIRLRYSLDAGSTWLTAVFDADYNDLYTFALEDIQVINN